MIVDPNKKTNEVTGFNPSVDNTTFNSLVTKRHKLLWVTIWIFSILTVIPAIVLVVYSMKWENELKREQVEINEAASAIDVNLTKRKETLIKLLDEAKGYMQFENDIMQNITELRTMGNVGTDIHKANQVQGMIDKVSSQFKINVENYPNLKSSTVVSELMSATQYIESEISASRRLYNLKVSVFNQNIISFPKSIKAEKLHLHSLPMFSASQEQKQDVDMSSLSLTKK